MSAGYSRLSIDQRDDRFAYGLIIAAIVVVAMLYRWWVREAIGLNLHFDEAQYVSWSYAPAFGYFSKPPMVAWMIAAARGVCGESAFCVRLPAALALLATTGVVYLLGRTLYGARVAAIAALLFALAPLNSLLAMFITTDAPLLLFWTLALWAFVHVLGADASGRRAEQGRIGWWLACGAFAGLGLMSKYTMGIFAVSALGFLATAARTRRLLATPGPYLGAAVAALIFIPNIVWNARHRFATLGHTAEISSLDRASFDIGRLFGFIGEQFGVYGPVAMLALTLGWVAGGRAALGRSTVSASPAGDGPLQPADAERLLFWFSIPFFAIIALQAFAARANANWAAPTYVAGSILAAAWLARRSRGWFVAALAVNLVIVGIAHHYRPLARAAGITLTERLDPMRQLEGWDVLGAAVAQRLRDENARLLVDERRLFAWFSYYARPQADDALIWNPSRGIDNHFRLLRDVDQAPRGPFLFVAEVDRGADLAREFSGVTALAPIVAGGRTLFVFRTGDFNGYAATGPAR